MSLYRSSLTIPKNTPETSPVSVEINPIDQVLGRISIYLPPGCLDAVHWRIFDGAKQIAPLPSGWLDTSETWMEGRRLEGPPRRIVLEGYSEAVDYEHTITIVCEIGKDG